MKTTKIVILILVIFLLSFFSAEEIKTVTTDKLTRNDKPTIIIDAGHGGEDGGAVAKDGTVEKDINLQIALKTNEILSVFGYQTHLIRDTDISVHSPDADTLRKRKSSDIHNRKDSMNKFEDCIFLSIHQNKYQNSKIWGAQTFYSPNDTKSPILAKSIQDSLIKNIQPKNKRIPKKSGTEIFVLYYATKPAVMVECGFISNYDELKNLKDNEYQNKIAFAITEGILNYFISEVKNGSEN